MENINTKMIRTDVSHRLFPGALMECQQADLRSTYLSYRSFHGEPFGGKFTH